jgi:IS4 transposase
LRRVAYWVEKNERVFEFISNNFSLTVQEVTEIYQQRWQIETMFKRLKQNFPLKYFLGDNLNAIEIQIWVGLIIQLILLTIQKTAKKK